MMHLSKSDFKVARTCPTKLYYKKLGYPSKLDEDPYLEFLADGGYMVETIAKLLFPEGREINFDSVETAVESTRQALKSERATLFEATLLFGQLLARVDILEKRGNHFRLSEVKAKSFNSETDGASPFRGAQGRILAKWIPYLEDVAFQTHILRNAFPGSSVTACLCIVDKSRTCGTGTSFDKFQIVPRQKQRGVRVFSRPEITFIGDIDSLRRQPIVEIIDVTQEVDELLPEVRQSATEFASSLSGEQPTRIQPSLEVRCKKCEYRLEQTPPPDREGFRECWGELAAPVPHLLDFYRIDLLGPKGQIAEKMIREGRCGIRDISKNDLRGKTGERQTIQLDYTLKEKEFISPELPGILEGCKYPLHFIDFEASRLAVPYHSGMHPYEQVAFQWSCHTIPTRGSNLVHQEWINVDEAYPNFDFARSLQNVINLGGTVFVWSPFERSTLSDVRRQLVSYGHEDLALSEWLDAMVADQGPLVDLCNLAKEHYFHPRMGGSLSIKHVLPAVWFESSKIRNHPWFAQYLREVDGQILEPYEALDPLPFGDDESHEEAEAVREGTAAMRTYQEMMYGLHRSDATFRATKKELLLNYCKLDTAAMVMIWMHWIGNGA
jgi:hypothetical protein